MCWAGTAFFWAWVIAGSTNRVVIKLVPSCCKNKIVLPLPTLSSLLGLHTRTSQSRRGTSIDDTVLKMVSCSGRKQRSRSNRTSDGC